MILEHLRQCWTNHVGAAAAIFSLINGQTLLNSLVTGVSVFLATYFLRVWLDKIFGKK